MALLWCAAAFPVLLLFYMMVIKRRNALVSALASLVATITSAVFLYGVPADYIFVECGKGVWSSLTVLYVVWTALLFYELSATLGIFSVVQGFLARFSHNELLRILFIACGVTSFFQAITGFGVPIVIGAPLLTSIGVRPLWAVVLCTMGHTWANTYGTLALAWDTLILQSGLSDAGSIAQVGMYTGIFLWAFNAISLLLICWCYGKKSALCKGLPAVLVISTIQGGGQLLFTQFSPVLATFIPTLLSMVAIWLLGHTKRYGQVWRLEDSPVMQTKKHVEKDAHPEPLPPGLVAAPYLILIAVSLLVILVQPLQSALKQLVFSLDFAASGNGLGFITPSVQNYAPLYPLVHAGAYLGLTALLTAALFMRAGRLHGPALRTALTRTMHKAGPVSLGIMLLIVMANIMGGTGQIDVLARGTVQALGQSYLVLSPFIGMVGSFITSSNMASNILFTEFQARSAGLLGLSHILILAGQTVGGSIGCTMSPGNILLGAGAAGIRGQEGAILARLLPLTLFSALLVGIVLCLLVF